MDYQLSLVVDKDLHKAQAKSISLEPIKQPTEPKNILPVQPNYHVLLQIKSTYTSEQLHHDAWEYIFNGKAPKSDNPEDHFIWY